MAKAPATKTKKPRKAKAPAEAFDIADLELSLTDPRRINFVKYFWTPGTKTYGNALQSALKAGFSPGFSKNILSFRPVWLMEIMDKMRNTSLLEEAHEKMKEDLQADITDPVIGMFGPAINPETGEVLRKRNSKVMKIRQDAYLNIINNLDPAFQPKQKNQFDPASVNIVFNYIAPKDDKDSAKPTHIDPVSVPPPAIITVDVDNGKK